jgi:hypothetical protein
VPGSVVTDENGNYVILADIGEIVIITKVWKDGYVLVSGTPPFETYDADATADFAMLIGFYVSGTVYIKGTTTGIEGVTIEYTIGGVPGSVVTGENGKYAIPVGAGETVTITNVWKDGHVLMSNIPPAFLRDAEDAHFEMDVLSSHTDGDDGSSFIMIIIPVILTSAFAPFLLWLLKRRGAAGT